MPNQLTVFIAGGAALVLTGALLGSGIQGYTRAQKPDSQISPLPETPIQPTIPPTQSPTIPPTQTQPAAIIARGTISTPGHSGANLRNAPSRKDAVIEGILKPGTSVTISRKQGDYAYITTDKGVEGWVHQSTIVTE